MFPKALKLFTLVSSALASITYRNVSEGQLEWLGEDSSLPKILVYDTGGTILKTSNFSHMDNIAYGQGPPLTAEDLIGNISDILSVAQLAIMPYGGDLLSSSSADSSLFMGIAQHANEHVCSEDSDIAGAVLIHGSNTLEETIFGIDLTFNCNKPFVATGSVRPNNHYSPDGHANLYNAISTAASPSSHNRGALVVWNDDIMSARYVSKRHANNPHAFGSGVQGAVGTTIAGQPYYFYDGGLPTGRTKFDVKDAEELPSVSIVYIHQGFDQMTLAGALQNGAKGVVVIGTGAGGLSPEAVITINALFEEGIPSVIVGRPQDGTGIPNITPTPFIKAGFLDAPKARIMLQLAIGAGYDMQQIRDIFEGPLRSAVFSSANGKWFSS